MINFNQARAAEALGIKRQAVNKKLKSEGKQGLNSTDLMAWLVDYLDRDNQTLRDKIAANNKIKADLVTMQRIVNRQ